jgi:lipopolysaccharide exporter
MTSELSQRVGSAVTWGGANQLFVKVTNIAVMVVVARLVAPHEFGVFAVAITVHAIVSNIGELGVSSCLMRGDMDEEEIGPTVAAISLATGAALGTLMFAFADSLSAALGSAQAAPAMRVMALAVLLVGVFAVPSALLVRDFRQDKVFLATVVAAVPANVALVLLAARGEGAMAFAWSRVLGQLVMGAIVWWAAGHSYLPRFDRGVARRVLRFGLPLAGSNLVAFTMLNADYAVVGHALGPARLGLYVLAFNVASWSTSLMAAVINAVVMPAFSRLTHDPAAFASALGVGTATVASVALPFAAVSAVLAGPLITTLYGTQWQSASSVLTVLAPYGALAVLCLLFGNVLVGLARTRLVLVVQLVWLGTLVPAMLVGVHLDGAHGVAVAHIAVLLVVVFPIYLVALTRAVGSGVPRLVARAAALPLLASLAAAVAGAGAATLPGTSAGKLLLGGVVAVLVYVVVNAPTLQEQIARFLPLSWRRSAALSSYARLAGSLAWLVPAGPPAAPPHRPPAALARVAASAVPPEETA